MKISGFVKTSLSDYPGIISAVVFTQGCNDNCFYCHNRQLIPNGSGSIREKDVIDFLKARKGKLGGVVVTGGEPTMQEDLPDFLGKLKQMGYKVKLDTNGSHPTMLSSILEAGLVDCVAIDYKAPAAQYPMWCGQNVRAERVVESIRLIQQYPIFPIVRTTVFPQLTETALCQMAQELPLLPYYKLQVYRKPEQYMEKDKALIEQQPYTAAQVSGFAETLRTWQPNTIT